MDSTVPGKSSLKMFIRA